MDIGDINNDDIEVLKEKLRLKTESLLLLNKQLETTLREKDELKRLYNSIYDKNLILKKKLFSLKTSSQIVDKNNFDSNVKSDDQIRILKESIRTQNKEKCELELKNDDLKHELENCKTDLNLLREKLDKNNTHDNDKHLIITDKNRRNLIKEIEAIKEEKLINENDYKLLECQKEELDLEVKSYRIRIKDLNELLASEYSNIKIDDLISQNRFLNESNQNLKMELSFSNEKYQKLKDTLKNKQYLTEERLYNFNIVNKNQLRDIMKVVNEFLNENSLTSGNFSIPNLKLYKLLEDLNSVCGVLVDNLNDKTTALVHQKKVNKMLSERKNDLENQLKKLLGDDLSDCEESFINFDK